MLEIYFLMNIKEFLPPPSLGWWERSLVVDVITKDNLYPSP